MIDVTDPAAVRAEAERRQQLRASGARSFDVRDPSAIAKSELDEQAREKAVEHEGDRIMRALGFDVVRFSHPGRTKQTPGIADRRYRHAARKLALWWEAKAEWGVQSPAQRVFQEQEEACGAHYVLGTHHDLLHWLQLRHVCRVDRDGTITPLPIDQQR